MSCYSLSTLPNSRYSSKTKTKSAANSGIYSFCIKTTTYPNTTHPLNPWNTPILFSRSCAYNEICSRLCHPMRFYFPNLQYPMLTIKAITNKDGSSNSETAGKMEINGNKKMTRYAVVTGANKGIGLETVRQLALAGVEVVLSARSEKRGKEAVVLLHESGLSNVVFHQLDVLEPDSISALVDFVEKTFGRLDILVNNAGASGVIVDADGLRSMNIDPESWLSGKATNIVQPVMKTTHESALQCLNTNYYGCRRVAEALLPLLQLSDSGANIVNVTSLRGELKRIPNEVIRKELNDINTLTEDRIDNILEKFLDDLKHDALEANMWQKMLPAYSISKATLNAYTRVLAKKYPKMRINCVHPGYVDTDLNWHTGPLLVQDGAKGSVMLALLNKGGPTGCYFDQTEMAEF